MNISTKDRDILRRLATEQARIAALPIHHEKAELWRRLNDRQAVRPMVWINEICWNEMNVDDELTLQCQDPWRGKLNSGCAGYFISGVICRPIWLWMIISPARWSFIPPGLG